MSSVPVSSEPRTSHEFVGEFAFMDSPERAKVVRSGARVPISPWVRQLVFRRDGWQCKICGSSPWAAATRRRSGPLHLDHIVPWSAGGSDRTDNLRTLCERCNMRRSNYVPEGTPILSMPIIRACVPCLSQGRFGLAAVPNPLEVFCGCCHDISFSFQSAAIL